MEPPDALQTFRRSLYECFHRRRDALFELTDAILAADGAAPSPAHLSLKASHRRGWGSLYAALDRGRIDEEALRKLLARHPLDGTEGEHFVYAVARACGTAAMRSGAPNSRLLLPSFSPLRRPAYRGGLVLPVHRTTGLRARELERSRGCAARAFAGSARVHFPPPLGESTAYLFPFSDQVLFFETLDARTALSRLALDPPWVGALLAALVRLGVTSAMRWRAGSQERVQRLSAWLKRRLEGHDWYGAVVEVQVARGRVQAGLVGRDQATGTAIGAAAVVRALAEGEVEQSGIWLAEQVVPPGPFFERLAARGLVPTVENWLEA